VGSPQYIVEYSINVRKKDLPSIPSPYRETIEKKIKMKLSVDPYKYGEPLSGKLKGQWKLKVGHYRVLYEVHDDKVIVFILTIDVRGNVYD
jgi:mRNA interferase RelE/StbE